MWIEVVMVVMMTPNGSTNLAQNNISEYICIFVCTHIYVYTHICVYSENI
jgi:hypothetical protein